MTIDIFLHYAGRLEFLSLIFIEHCFYYYKKAGMSTLGLTENLISVYQTKRSATPASGRYIAKV